jgi:microcystin-dependent protein
MDPFIGQIQAFGFTFAPQGWQQCNGQLISIAQNTALFALLGTTYGGNGQTTFALPDLRGRSMVHPGNGPGLSTISWGQVSGIENTTLLPSNLPPHNHSVSVSVNTATGEDALPTNKIASGTNRFSEDVASGAFLGGLTELVVGGSQPFAIRNPYLALNVCIAMQGIFPSRN